MLVQCPRNKEEQCYILDDNAYILSDPDAEHTGKFFGSVEKKLMHILIDDKIYEPIKIYDYQAVCYDDRMVEYEHLMTRSSALNTFFWNPFKFIATVVITFLSTVYALPSYMANCEYHYKFYCTISHLSFSVMYPDPEHFYDAETNREFHCPNVHETDFVDCLVKEEVLTNDTTNEKYKSCLEDKVNRYKKCHEENGTEFVLKRHFNRTRYNFSLLRQSRILSNEFIFLILTGPSNVINLT